MQTPPRGVTTSYGVEYARRCGNRAWAGRLKKFLLPFVIVLGPLVAAEGMLQVLAASSRSVAAALSVTPVRGFIADRALSWRGNPDYPVHDRLGFRNSSVPSKVQVVALGDSQTYGSNVRPSEAWPHALGDMGLGPSYNMAFPGGDHCRVFSYSEALPLKPRLIVEALYLGNDLVDSFTFVYNRDRLEQFKSPDEKTRQAVAEADRAEPWDDLPIADQSPVDREDDDPRDESPEPLEGVLRAHSKLYGLWHAAGRAYNYYRRHPERPEADDENDPLKDDDFVRFRGAYFSTVLTPNYRLPAVELDDPRIVEGMRITVEALSQMHQRSRAEGVDFAVLFIPTKELALADVVAAEQSRLPLEVAYQVTAEVRVREALRDRLEAHGIPLIDSLPALQALAADGVLPYSECETAT